MRIKLGDWDFQATVGDESSTTSRHTGNGVLARKISFRVRGANINDQVAALIQQARNDYLQSLDDDGDRARKWRVGNFSSSHRDDETVFTYQVDLQEVEELNCSALIIGDLELAKPYIYAESDEDQKIVVEAKVCIDSAQHQQLKELDWGTREVVPVVRRGIREEPLQMRFGLCYWSEDGESFRHKLNLIEASDDDLKGPLNELSSALLWLQGLRKQTVRGVTLVNALLETLVQKGVITAEEVEALRQEAKAHNIDATYEIFKVLDVDKI